MMARSRPAGREPPGCCPVPLSGHLITSHQVSPCPHSLCVSCCSCPCQSHCRLSGACSRAEDQRRVRVRVRGHGFQDPSGGIRLWRPLVVGRAQRTSPSISSAAGAAGGGHRGTPRGRCQDGRGKTKWQLNYNPEEMADVKPGNHQ